ncbi:MAG: thiamine pyrophosphate-binding protein, partial [Deltaproteobacteria bacterium]|nr:thiamine pyrophosphate-binding protein [Deltaproteobacteria bacterium]
MTEATQEVPMGYREMQPNSSTKIAEALVEHGVKIVFGIQGGHIWQMVDEISNAGIKNITTCSEQTAVYAAEAYSKVTRKPAVCYATVGPGVGNSISAIQQAYFACSPVIFLGGGNAVDTDYLPVIQPSYVMDLMRFITRWSQRITDTTQIKQFIARAFKDAQIYPKRPIALEMPLGMLLKPPGQAGFYGVDGLWMEKWRDEDTGAAVEPGGDPDLIAKAIKVLWEAKKPLIFAGDGCHWSDAGKALVEFAETAQIPVVTRRIARGCFPETHSLYVDSRAGRKALQAADLRLSMGQKVGSFDEFGMGWAPTIQVNESMEQIWTFLKTPVAIVGSPRVVLKQMTEYVKANNIKPPAGREEWVKFCEETQKGGYAERVAKAEKFKDHKPVHYGYLAKAVWDVCEEMYGG